MNENFIYTNNTFKKNIKKIEVNKPYKKYYEI